jgi:hypothetical protein
MPHDGSPTEDVSIKRPGTLSEYVELDLDVVVRP